MGLRQRALRSTSGRFRYGTGVGATVARDGCGSGTRRLARYFCRLTAFFFLFQTRSRLQLRGSTIVKSARNPRYYGEQHVGETRDSGSFFCLQAFLFQTRYSFQVQLFVFFFGMQGAWCRVQVRPTPLALRKSISAYCCFGSCMQHV